MGTLICNIVSFPSFISIPYSIKNRPLLVPYYKSQGMTLDAAEIDLSKSFIEGMGYVALSRVKSLKSLKLLGINDMAFRVNREVSDIDKNLINISKETVANLKKMGFIRRWLKKRKFMHNLTSQ